MINKNVDINKTKHPTLDPNNNSKEYSLIFKLESHNNGPIILTAKF